MTAAAHLKRFFATWNRHDPDAIAALYTTEARMEDPTLVAPLTGIEQIRGYYEEMFAALERPKHQLLDWAQRGDRVWFEWTFASGGDRQPQVCYHGVSIHTLSGDLIRHDQAFWSPDA
jgi:ketosteroid isomerase-like protein